MNDNQAQCFPLPRQSLPGGATLTSGTSSRAPFIQGKTVMEGRSSSNLSITPSVTITPTSGPVMNLKTKNVSWLKFHLHNLSFPVSNVTIFVAIFDEFEQLSVDYANSVNFHQSEFDESIFTSRG